MDLLERGYLFAYGSVFAAGVLTSLTPCVYPLITITVSIFGARDENTTRARAILLGLLYVAGICVMYTGLGVFSALAGKQFGTFLTNKWVMLPVVIFMLAMAASMFGAFEIRLPTGLATWLQSKGGKGYGSAFVMGAAGGIIAAPCTGPVLASVLTVVAAKQSVGLGASLLFVYALGLGLLFFLVAAFALSLPRSGAWMETVKKFFGVIITDVALYFLRNLIGPLNDYRSNKYGWLAIHVVVAIVGIFLVLYSRRMEKRDAGSPGLRSALVALGCSTMIIGFYGTEAWIETPRAHAAWVHSLAQGEAQQKAEKKPMVIDFFADWCLPCKELDVRTFSDPTVARELDRFTLVKIDCTQDDNEATIAAQKKYDAETLPTVVILDSDGKVQKRVTAFTPPADFLPLLQAVK